MALLAVVGERRNSKRNRRGHEKMVPGVGVEPLAETDTAQLIDSMKRQKRETLQKRLTEVHGGYTE
jgi:hypothetical protein